MSGRVSAGQLRNLSKLRCWVFDQPFNPDHKRIGSKVLREPLKGTLMKDYYYPSLKILPTPKKLNKIFGDMNCYDPDEEYRLERVDYLKRKGKGAPKKLKEKKVSDNRRR